MKITECKPTGRFFGLFISTSGGGKSSAAATFPKPLKFFDFDQRIRGILWEQKLVPDFDKIEYDSYLPAIDGFPKVEKELETIQTTIAVKQPSYKTLVFDSLTNQLRMFLTDAMELTKGITIGTLRKPSIGDFGYEAEACYQVFDFLRSIPINIIVTAHIVPRFGKEDPSKEYSENVEVGQKLSIRDKIGANIMSFFDEVYEFKREEIGNKIKHFVKFQGELARSVHPGLHVSGWHDITDRNFYDLWKEMVDRGHETNSTK